MHFMVIEHFVNGARPIYERFERDGRLMPEDGLTFVSSYVTADLSRCFQLMEATTSRSSRRGSPTGRTSPTSRSSRSSPEAG